MEPKNIIFKHTLKDYNKRYRHHKNLLKFTKKEVEEFDRQANTIGEHYVLRNNKWWLIEDTYYQVPKALHHYWFRNLNAGAQTAICLLGAGVIATGASLPFILKPGQTVEPTITVQGADFDKTASHIELNKDSTIALKQKGSEEIIDVTEVKIAGKTITKDTDWTYKDKKVEIKAHAMTSLDIQIIVETKDPTKVVTRDQFVRKANDWVTGTDGFMNSKTVYDKEDLEMEIKGSPITIDQFKYYEAQGDRSLFAGPAGEITATVCLAGINYSGDNLLKLGKLKEESVQGVTYTITNEYICYVDENATAKEFKEIKLNNYGYVLSFNIVNGNNFKVKYSKAPHEPKSHVVTKAEWIKKANDLNADFLKSKLEYTADQLTYKENGEKTDFTDFAYGVDVGGKRTLEITVDGNQVDLGSSSYSGDYLNQRGQLNDAGTYEIYDDKIVYKYPDASGNKLKALHINKYGYPIYEAYGKYYSENIWDGDPEEPVTPVVTKTQFIAKVDEWINGDEGFCGTDNNTEYTKDDLTLTLFGTKLEKIDYFEYTGTGANRELYVGKDSTAEGCIKVAFAMPKATLEAALKVETTSGVEYKFSEDGSYISYTDSKAAAGEFSKYIVNKYGYVMCYECKDYENYGFSCEYKNAPTEKNKFVSIADEWIIGENGFCYSTLEYTQDQITKYVEEGEEEEVTSVSYSGSKENRKFTVNGTTVASSGYSGTALDKSGKINDNGNCEFKDNEIVYKYNDADDNEYKELHINKYGYPTYELYGDDTLYEIEFGSEPKETSIKLTYSSEKMLI